VFVRDFASPASSRARPAPRRDLHGPISTGPKANRVYFGYGTNKDGVLQIVDREKLLSGPKEPTAENLLYPQVAQARPAAGQRRAHPRAAPRMSLPEFAKDAQGAKADFVMIVNEQIVNECRETRQRGGSSTSPPRRSRSTCRASTSRRRWAISARAAVASARTRQREPALDVREAPGVRRVVQRGGTRDRHPRSVQPERSRLLHPAKTGKTDKRCVKMQDGKERCKSRFRPTTSRSTTAATSYIVDRANTGMHILQVTGEARKIANF